MERAGDYPAQVQVVIVEMHRQAATLVTNERTVAAEQVYRRRLAS